MEKEKLDKIINSLDKTNMLSQDIESNIAKINETISAAPISILESFEKYTDPQLNVQEINRFYRLFIEVIEQNNTHKISHDIKKNYIESMNNYYFVKTSLARLNEYIEIKIVKRYIEKTKKAISPVLESLTDLFYKSFNEYLYEDSEKNSSNGLASERSGSNLDKHKSLIVKFDELVEVAHFLEHENEKMFIEQFCKTLIDKYKCKQNAEFIEHLKALNDDFVKIQVLCKGMLNEKNSENVNIEVKQLIVVDAKSILSRILLNYENKYKQENLYSCTKLYLYLNKSEVKRYFLEFNENILKVIHNLLLTFLSKIDEVRKPKKDVKNEETIVLFFKTIKCFENDCFLEFFEKYRSGMEFKNYEQLKTFSGEILTDKIFELSKTLKGIQRNVYLLNNLYLLQFFYKVHKETPMVEFIEVHSNEIIQIWESEIRKRKESEFTKFLDVNLEIQSDYYLPETIRTNIVDKIRECVLDVCKEKTYKKGENVLRLKINDLFTGKP